MDTKHLDSPKHSCIFGIGFVMDKTSNSKIVMYKWNKKYAFNIKDDNEKHRETKMAATNVLVECLHFIFRVAQIKRFAVC